MSEGERGQSTVEWIGLVLVVAMLVGIIGALVGLASPGAALARAISSRLACAIELSAGCEAGASPLAAAYGEELAKTVAAHAPELVYERGMRALPVDYRSCREDPCSLGPESGEVSTSFAGEPVTLFVHAVDCRDGRAPPGGAGAPVCSGERDGALYLQYWAYYPGSNTRAFGDRGFHPDDWESAQLRVTAAGTDARASSHHGYNYEGGVGNWLSDAGIAHRAAWGPDQGRYFISGGSHAGHASDPDAEPHRWTPPDAIRLVPMEPIAAAHPETPFAITPPWRKHVWTDPEYAGTD